jgi:hypothetical protein
MRSIGWAIRWRADRNAVAWRHCSLGTEGGCVSRAARAPSLDRLFLCASHDKTKPTTGSVVQGLGFRHLSGDCWFSTLCQRHIVSLPQKN